jgi:NAD-dependent dihydropyrimidine dehydrogenase PreA subunit
MIRVNQALCEGCGVCIEECPTEAITLVDGAAMVDAALCNGCAGEDEMHNKACVEICPNEALSWIAEPALASAPEPSSLVVVEPSVEVIPVSTGKPALWRRAIVPAVGGALTWVGREVVPRLAPLALDVLDRRISRWSRDENATPAPTGRRRGGGRQQRRRRRRGQ